MRWRGTMVIGLGMLLYVGVLWYVNGSKPGASVASAGSSQSVGATGSLAVARLWDRLGLPFQPWAQVPGLLPQSADVFVSVSPDPTQYHARETQDLLSWIRSGHDAVWVSSRNDPLLVSQRLSVHTSTRPVVVASVTRHGLPVSAPIRLAVGQGTYLYGSGLDHALVTVRSQQGTIVAAELTVGGGHLWLCSLPAVFFNRTVGQEDNLQLVWLMMGNRGVLWDEYGHGVVAQSLLQATFSHGRQWSLLWFAMTAILFVWLAVTRFGRPQQDVSEQGRHHGEWLAALAHQLRRPKLKRLREELIRENLGRRLGRELSPSQGSKDLQRLTRELWREAGPRHDSDRPGESTPTQ